MACGKDAEILTFCCRAAGGVGLQHVKGAGESPRHRAAVVVELPAYDRAGAIGERRPRGYQSSARTWAARNTPKPAKSAPRGDALGQTLFDVNLVELPPGCWSAQRHWHSREGEFAYLPEGALTPVPHTGGQVLRAE